VRAPSVSGSRQPSCIPRSVLERTTPHSRPFLITRAHARARARFGRIYDGCVHLSGHTDAHTTHSHTRHTRHTRVEQFVCASLLVEPNLTSSTLRSTTTAAAVNIHATLILLRSSIVSRVRVFTAQGGSGVTRYPYTRHARFAVVDAHS